MLKIRGESVKVLFSLSFFFLSFSFLLYSFSLIHRFTDFMRDIKYFSSFPCSSLFLFPPFLYSSYGLLRERICLFTLPSFLSKNFSLKIGFVGSRDGFKCTLSETSLWHSFPSSLHFVLLFIHGLSIFSFLSSSLSVSLSLLSIHKSLSFFNSNFHSLQVDGLLEWEIRKATFLFTFSPSHSGRLHRTASV